MAAKRERPWLLPLVPLYAAGVAWRSRRIESGVELVQRLRWPVISVGNLSVGGTGKTPFVIALARLLSATGQHVDVLSRGYGRRGTGAARVDPAGTAEEFGDEPLLITSKARIPVYVGRRRFDAGVLAEAEAEQNGISAGVHLLDDGFQHRQLYRDIDILLINREDWFDGRLLPAGNLREPLRAAMRATVIAIPEEDTELDADLRRVIPLDRNSEGPVLQGTIWKFRREMSVPAELTGADPALAFCGIARPEQFFAGLEAAGVKLAACHAFRDHHRFTASDIARLLRMVRSSGARALVTTDKDRVRLGAMAHELEQAAPLHTAGLSIVFQDAAGIPAWLQQQLRP
jgi:tetraacyldisaccharide 4'-kinase